MLERDSINLTPIHFCCSESTGLRFGPSINFKALPNVGLVVKPKIFMALVRSLSRGPRPVWDRTLHERSQVYALPLLAFKKAITHIVAGVRTGCLHLCNVPQPVSFTSQFFSSLCLKLEVKSLRLSATVR